MKTLRKYKSLLLCFMSLFFMAGMCEKDSDIEDVLVEEITLDYSKATLRVGESLTLTAEITPKRATKKSLAWESSNENIATVEAISKSEAEIVAVSPGKTTITAIAEDDSEETATCVITVVAANSDPNDPDTPDNPNDPGNSEDPNNPDTPNNPSDPGNSDNPSEPDPDVVLVTRITLDRETTALSVGGELMLTPSIYPNDATEKSLLWTSSNENVAVVQDGWVMAIAPGQAVITATAEDGSGVSASCVVTVSENVYSPVAAKNKMESVGVSFVNAIKANAHQNLVELMDYSVVTFEDFEVDEAYYEKLASLVEEEYEDYARGVNPVRAMMGMTDLCLHMAQKGAQLSTRSGYVYALVLKAGLSDLYGKFTPDYANEVWKWNSNVKDRVEVAFTDADGQQWVATLKGSARTTRIHITAYCKNVDGGEIYIGGPYDGQTNDWSNGDTDISNVEYVIDVPETLTFAVTCNGRTVISLDLDSSLAFNLNYEEDGVSTFVWRYDGGDEYSYSYAGGYEFEGVRNMEVDYENLNLDATLLVNGYEETFKTDISKKGISASAGIKIDGRNMLSANASIKANMDALISDANDDSFKAGNIENFSMNFDVLNEVQLDVACPNFKNLYDAVSYLAEAEGINSVNTWLDEVNAAYSAKLRFDKTSSVQAKFEFEAEEEDGFDYSGIYFYPVMEFAYNGSRYSLDEYFTESAFSELIAAVERLAEQFEDLYDDYFEDESYPDYDDNHYPGYGGY